MSENYINIDFSGWISIKARNLSFQYCGNSKNLDSIINGEEWLSLTPDDQADYILDSLNDAMRDSENMEWDNIVITEEI